MNEIRKPVPEYGGLYEVSSHGNVYGVDRFVNQASGGQRFIKGKILKQWHKFGYKCVILCKQGKCKSHRVHRLVAKTFLINHLNKPQVNHIDGNKENNCIVNLEWTTGDENINHATTNGLYVKNRTRTTCRLDDVKVLTIHTCRDFFSNEKIAIALNTTPKYVHAVKKGKTWKKIASQLAEISNTDFIISGGKNECGH